MDQPPYLTSSTPAGDPTTAEIDLLAAIRSIRTDSRYSFTSPSSETVMARIDRLQARHNRIEPVASINSSKSSDNLGSTASASSSGAPSPTPTDEPYNVDGRVNVNNVFSKLTRMFGFQTDSIANIREYLQSMIESRTSRMGYDKALKTLHADYIGGVNANYRRWYLSQGLEHESVSTAEDPRKSTAFGRTHSSSDASTLHSRAPDLEDQAPEQLAELAWKRRMKTMPQHERVRQLALWLLIWGEAASVRLIPEALCFIFKLADDYYQKSPASHVEPGQFLNNVIGPLYEFLRNQTYKYVDGKLIRKERDHERIVGYDDMNETFWSRNGINHIFLKDGKSRLMDTPPSDRYPLLNDVDWKKTFHKTFYERRSFLHVLVNFGRIWILHLGLFLFFLAFAAGRIYAPSADDDLLSSGSSMELLSGSDDMGDGLGSVDSHSDVLRWTVTGVVGGVGVLTFALFSTIVEASFLPWRWNYVKIFARRFGFLLLLLLVNIVPAPYVILFTHKDAIAAALAALQVIIAVSIFIYLVICPPGSLFVSAKRPDLQPTNITFTANFAPLKPTERALSILLWPLKDLASVPWEECGKSWLWCRGLTYMALVVFVVLLLVLSFLDSYMWWILWSTIFGAVRAFYSGLSILAPWRNIFSRLPDRIYAKVFATNEMPFRVKPIRLCSQLWNAVVTSMYEDHLISIENLDKLLYRQYQIDSDTRNTRIEKPKFFVSQEDVSTKTEFFPKGSEAERRLTFFAQSLSMVFPEPMSVSRMPSFSVLTPHFSEKILLPLREIVQEQDPSSSLTLLEYLQKLHSFEWQNFVKDTKMWVADNPTKRREDVLSIIHSDHDAKDKIDDIPFQTFGFRDSNPEGILRTRIWASLRSQTLYRTVSGFMNYAHALRLLLRIENASEIYASTGNDPTLMEKEIDQIVSSKFNFVVAMQRFVHFTAYELADVELMLRIYPALKIAYIDERPDETLPGLPILGDGKSDNQNHSIIFTRGEVIQLIDANQDQYIEEALKIRSILAEFEPSAGSSSTAPVAIVGAREYIFSERIGVLGDIAAGREQCFGTIAQRVSSKLGARLHYGHPDFLNSIFMTTRGGVSKAQRGLHVNEDIYAGMMALQRGGRIKHTEYLQCGKGRDLGFASILKFVAKIGGGMAEQLLSREHYYLGTRLPVHRLFTFFYAHTGFHINNVMIMLSIQLFLIFMSCLAALSLAFTLCTLDGNAPASSLDDMGDGSLDGSSPSSCINLDSTLTWTRQAVFAIVVVFALNFLPLFTQLLTETGILPAFTRLAKNLISLSPLFDVFSTQMYAHTLLYNLVYGRAGYISSGRALATSRASFSSLYQAFADPSLYVGLRLLLMLCFITATLPLGGYLAFFWLMVLPLCIAPFLFNPHQFRIKDFLLDYVHTLKWFASGNATSSEDSWAAFHIRQRVQMIGNTRKRGTQSGLNRARSSAIIWQDILAPTIVAAIFIFAYGVAAKSIIKVLAVCLLPCILNAVMLVALLPLSCIFGPLLLMCGGGRGCLPAALANIAHGWAVLTLLVAMLLLGLLSNGNYFAMMMLGFLVTLVVQRALFRIMTVTMITREIHHRGAHLAWWSGNWCFNNLGWAAFFLPLREFIVKVLELSSFAADFWQTHLLMFLLFPICLVPFIDQLHLLMLLWTLPRQQTGVSFPVYTAKQKAGRRRSLCCGGLLLTLLLILFLFIFVGPKMVIMVMGPGFVNRFKLPF
ncbi:1,3-beta-glucan synthase [Synchytrium endobioticum]|uniref:1,3-beta-glucan synthase n=1 Tax=Synchytrium endobioticum TaxID=286115 RepID=A0A507CL92_9FUNG|nr:1,3-beta-glucan synthase [Synchytrium endobioticum]